MSDLVQQARRWSEACNDPYNHADGKAGPKMGEFLWALADEIDRLRAEVLELEEKLEDAHEFCGYGDDL